jgi:hypothetical protein
MVQKKTGLTVPAGILQPTTPPDDPPEPLADEGQGGEPAKDEGQEARPAARTARKNKVTGKASSGKVEGRRLYLSEGVHFRLRLYAYQRGVKLSEAAEELLDRALPKWDVNRVG